jgi:gliding motility-associated-like protein
VLPTGCAGGCATFKAIIPDIRGQSNTYTVNLISGSTNSCFTPYVAPNSNNGKATTLDDDDSFGPLVALTDNPIYPFAFTFFGSNYTHFVAGTNGEVCFDVTRANQPTSWQLGTDGVGLSGSGAPLNLPSALYERAIIMGPRHDIDLSVSNSPTMKAQYEIIGDWPNRRWVLSFYKMPLFSCNSMIQNTHQIILYESTGIIEVYVKDRQRCPGWNMGRAMIGMQDYSRTLAVMAPGRKASDTWEGLNMNEAWRFIPSQGISLLKRVELVNLATGAVLATALPASVTNLGNGNLEATFSNICSPLGLATLIIRPVYQRIDKQIFIGNPALTGPNYETWGADTLRVTRPGGPLSPTATATDAACASGGTITVTENFSGPLQYKLDGGALQSSNVFTNVAPGPHTVYVTDPGGACTGTTTVTVNSANALQAVATNGITSCPAASDGVIQVNATSGTPPFEYKMGTGAYQTSNSFTGLAVGSYQFYIKDINGCTSNAIPGSVTPGTAVSGSATSTAPSCQGASDGTITASGSGSGTFEYALNAAGPWQSSPVFNNLPQGGYNVYVRRSAACISPAIPVSIAPGNQLTATHSETTTSCQGASDATVTITAQNGAGPFEYSMGTSGTWQASNVFNALATGNYNFYMRNAAGCITAAIPVQIQAGLVLQGNATPTATSCAGASDGSVAIAATNGAGPFEYRMGTTGIWQSSSTFSGLAAQNGYVFYIRNAAGCVSNAITADVAPGATLQATTTATPTSCVGANNGSVVVNATSGSGPFEYRMGATGVWQTSKTFSNLASSATPYSFYVRNASGCISNPADATINDGPAVTAQVTSTPTSCSGASDGTVTVTATGNGPFEYTMGTSGVWQTSGVFSGLPSGGPYNFYVRNAYCTSPAATTSVAPGSTLQGSATANPPSCSGASNATVTVNALSGNPPYEYRRGISGAWQSSATFTGLAPGPDSFYVKTGSCISDVIRVTIPPGVPLTATTTVTNVSCFGGSDGTVTINPPSSGTGYTFSKDNFATQQTNPGFTGLAAAPSYTFWLKDNAGCAGTVTATVNQPTQLSSTNPVVTNAKCNGSADGTITVSGSGGTAPYLYSLNGGTNTSSNSFTVASGTHNIVITDSKGCTFTVGNIQVNQPPVLDLNIVQQKNASCNGGADGQIILSGSGGTAPYKYSATGFAAQNSGTFNVNPGSYTVAITDYNNCAYTAPAPAVIGLTNDMAYTPMADIIICEGTSGTLQPQTNAIQFVWKGPAITPNNTAQSSITVKPVADTFYSVTATYGRCSYNDTVNVDVNAAPVADAGPGNTICFGKSDTLSASGGVSYEWSPTTYLSGNITGPDPVVNAPQKTITYTLYVRDGAGCRSLQPSTVTVNVTPPLLVVVNPIDTIGYFGDSIRIRAMSIGTSYTWTPVVGLSNPNIDNPTVYVTTDRIYTVTATTAAGCSGEGSFKLRAYKGPDIYVPTAFTPNGDGLNDRVRPFSVGIEKLNYFRIFDRWGQLMYEYKGEKRGPVVYSMLQSTIGWDGSFHGEPLNTGTFVWLAEGVTKQGKIIFRKGSITLIR